ncbi:glyoxalase [Myroides marinus]|uniref:Glyoxalase n=1 Tax=Myroides marinus TaxID=703342 RepID=A0A163ZI61_9FLAO|nr:VOC family protein [Myroides marinus]KZE81817.1 glyoxalase [Myroides marinus]
MKNIEQRNYPVNFSHVGLTVPDLAKAITFYTEVMGWYHLSGPIIVNEVGGGRLAEIGKMLYGTGWKQFSFAHLSSADGIGCELFEFANNTDKESVNTPFRTGIFHFCVQDPNIEELVARIEEHGGEKMCDIIELDPGNKPYKMVYVKDPFGNMIEIYTHSYERHNLG